MNDLIVVTIVWITIMIVSWGTHSHLRNMEERLMLEIHELKKSNSSNIPQSQSHLSRPRWGVDL
jgi:hypothetical protein